VIKAEPLGSLVIIDGYPLGRQEDTSPFEIGLLIGRHWVEVKKEGYKPYLQEVELLTNRRVILNVTLEKEGREKK
jgi:hypothetical protein